MRRTEPLVNTAVESLELREDAVYDLRRAEENFSRLKERGGSAN